jgi:hypothetical protein
MGKTTKRSSVIPNRDKTFETDRKIKQPKLQIKKKEEKKIRENSVRIWVRCLDALINDGSDREIPGNNNNNNSAQIFFSFKLNYSLSPTPSGKKEKKNSLRN